MYGIGNFLRWGIQLETVYFSPYYLVIKQICTQGEDDMRYMRKEVITLT